VLVLFLGNLAAGVCFTAVAWAWLSLSLDKSLATRTLLTDLDPNVFVDLFARHGASLRMCVVTGLLLALLFCLLGGWFNAMAVLSVSDERGVGDSLRSSLGVYPAFLALWTVTIVLDAAGVGVAFLTDRGLVRWVTESATEMSFYWASGASLGLGVVWVLVLSVVHDHARIRVVATGSGPVRAYAWALRFVIMGERRALPLAVTVLGSGGALWAVYQAVGMLISTTSGPGIALSIGWGQLLLAARLLLRVWLFAAETELQSADYGGQ
jgi:hypothetical protein